MGQGKNVLSKIEVVKQIRNFTLKKIAHRQNAMEVEEETFE